LIEVAFQIGFVQSHLTNALVFHLSQQRKTETESLEFNIMGISDITSRLEGVGISSDRSRGCPAARARKGF